MSLNPQILSFHSFKNKLLLFLNYTPNQNNYATDFKCLEIEIKTLSKQSISWQYVTQIFIQYTQLQNNSNSKLYLLCSNILKDKLKYDVSQILKENLSYMHIIIINALNHLMSNNLQMSSQLKGTMKNLVLCLIYLYVHLCPENFVNDLVNFLKKNINNQNILIQILINIPYEISNRLLMIQQKKLVNLVKGIKNNIKYVLYELDSIGRKCWNNQNLTISRYSLEKCFNKWINLSFDEQQIDKQLMGQNCNQQQQYLCLIKDNFMLQKSFDALMDMDEVLIDQSAQIICSFIRLLRYHILRNNKNPYHNKYLQICSQLKFKFYPNYFQYIQIILSNHSNNPDLLHPYIKILCIFGSSCLSLPQLHFLQQSDYAFNYCKQMILINKSICMDWNIIMNESKRLLNFWNRFTIELMRQKNDLKDSGYIQICQQLYILLCQMIKYDRYQLEKQQWTQQKDYLRQDEKLMEIIKRISRIIGSRNLIQKTIGYSLGKQFNNKNWQIYEAIIFSIKLIDFSDQQTKQIDTNIDNILFMIKIFLKLIKIKTPYPKIQASLCSGLLDYLDSKSSSSSPQNIHLYKLYPQIIAQIYSHYILKNQSIQQTQLFNKFTSKFPIFVLDNYQYFLDLYSKFNHHFILNNLIKSIIDSSIIISSSKNYNENFPIQIINKYLPQIYTIILNQLNSANHDFLLIQQPLNNLNYLNSKIFTTVNQYRQKNIFIQILDSLKNIAKMIFMQTWEILKSFLQIFHDSPNYFFLTQNVCKILKYVMRTLQNQFSQFIKPVFNTIICLYQNYPISSFIYATQILITVFNNKKQINQQMQLVMNIYQNICKITFKHLYLLQNLKDNPDLVDDFFGMLTRFIRYAPNILIGSNQFKGIINLCQLACGVDQPGIAKVLYQFLQQLFHLFNDKLKIQTVQSWFNSNAFDCLQKHQQSQMQTQINKKQRMILCFIQEYILCNYQLISKMIKHLKQVPSQSIQNDIIDVLLCQIFNGNWGCDYLSGGNVKKVWTDLVLEMGNVLSQNEKEDFLDLLQMKDRKKIRDTINLINRRYISKALRSSI